jgi:Tfp pilus assembly pilus retraction ATPase PilT
LEGRVPAVELLIATPAVRNLIRKWKSPSIIYTYADRSPIRGANNGSGSEEPGKKRIDKL